MAWTWRFEKADGTEVQPAVQPEEFTTQGDAESWIGEVWKDLLEGGADQVVLFEDDTKIYGPMSLHADSRRAGAGAGPRAEGAPAGAPSAPPVSRTCTPPRDPRGCAAPSRRRRRPGPSRPAGSRVTAVRAAPGRR